uniref:Pyridoxal 5'-phosphate synthase subunit PdxT n=2 Tax=unclassified Prevotella TaxID=2638335 RepID=A0AB33JJP5_9BACT
MKIGVLALQGAFLEHAQMLERLGVETVEIRQLKDFQQSMSGLVIPGGESTVQLKLLHDLGLFQPIREAVNHGLPVFGTCAGLILLARHVVGDEVERLATIDMTVCRNAYGRQLGSFHTQHVMAGIPGEVPMTFIRAPYIQAVGDGVEVLAEVDGHIVAARQGHQLVTAFHPELTADLRVHQYFLNLIEPR